MAGRTIPGPPRRALPRRSGPYLDALLGRRLCEGLVLLDAVIVAAQVAEYEDARVAGLQAAKRALVAGVAGFLTGVSESEVLTAPPAVLARAFGAVVLDGFGSPPGSGPSDVAYAVRNRGLAGYDVQRHPTGSSVRRAFTPQAWHPSVVS